MIALSVHQLTRHYAQARQPALQSVSFEVADGQILALVGPSGCGKTTTLRLIAGLDRPDSGSIQIMSRIVADGFTFVPPEKRGVGMVFQDHALFPHLTVFDNVAFGLRGQNAAQVRERVREMLALVGLESLSGRYPHALSGGERQRVALARALAPRPALVLMDEPFSSLDADMRLEVRQQVRDILKAMRATVVFVTHDQDEAMFMGDQLALFHSGRLEQIGSPQDVFHAPATRFVAEFMGDSDFLNGFVAGQGINTEIGFLPQPVALPLEAPVEIALRSDDVDFDPDPAGNAQIIERFFRGACNVYRLRLDSGHELHACKEYTQILPVGVRVRAHISAGHPLAVFRDGVAVRAE